MYLDIEGHLLVLTIQGSNIDSASISDNQQNATKLAPHKVIGFCFEAVCSIPDFHLKPVRYRREKPVAALDLVDGSIIWCVYIIIFPKI